MTVYAMKSGYALMRSNIVPHYFPYRHFPIPFDSAEEGEVGYGIDDGGHGITP